MQEGVGEDCRLRVQIIWFDAGGTRCVWLNVLLRAAETLPFPLHHPITTDAPSPLISPHSTSPPLHLHHLISCIHARTPSCPTSAILHLSSRGHWPSVGHTSGTWWLCANLGAASFEGRTHICIPSNEVGQFSISCVSWWRRCRSTDVPTLPLAKY